MARSTHDYPAWLNLLGYQLLWFLAIFTGDKSLIIIVFFLFLHVYLSAEKVDEAAMVLFCTVVGLVIDSILTLSGIFVFDPAPDLLAIPLWLVGIWLAFSATLRLGLRFFLDRPPLALACAAIGAPLAYLSAGRLGAVEFPLGYLITGLIIAAIWVPLMVLLIVSSRWLDSRALA